jgi:hypothetical protein
MQRQPTLSVETGEMRRLPSAISRKPNQLFERIADSIRLSPLPKLPLLPAVRLLPTRGALMLLNAS